jgi:hypothetical protein
MAMSIDRGGDVPLNCDVEIGDEKIRAPAGIILAKDMMLGPRTDTA